MSGPRESITPTTLAVRDICAKLVSIGNASSDGVLGDEEFSNVEMLFTELRSIIDATGQAAAARVLADVEIGAGQFAVQKLQAVYEARAEQLRAATCLDEPTKTAQSIVDYMAENLAATTIHAPQFKQALAGRRHCLVVGCGAFPSTAILLREQTDLQLTCVDRCASSCDLGARIVRRLDQRRIDFRHCDVDALDDLSAWEVIFVSALAGVDWHSDADSRRRLIESIAERVAPGTLLALRTPYALGQLIYPSVERDWFEGYQISEVESPVVGRSSLLLVET